MPFDANHQIVPAEHHYALGIIRIAVGQVVESQVSLRGAAHQFALWTETGLSFSVPSYSSIRQWVLRVGLYEWQRPKERREDWIFILDFTIELGPHKCLVILGISQLKWQQKLAAEEFGLQHQEMEVLQIAVMSQTKGEQIQHQIEQLSLQVGQPVQIISDHGSDLKKGIELYQAAHPQVLYTYDVTHQMARLLRAQLETDEIYQTFIQRSARTRQQLQQSQLSFLAPPAQRAKSRYLNVEPGLEWANHLQQYYQRQDFSLIDARFCLDTLAFETLSSQLTPSQLAALRPLQDQVYEQRGAFIQALHPHLNESLEPSLQPLLVTVADWGRRQFTRQFGWLLDLLPQLSPYQQMLSLVESLQRQLHQNGLTAAAPDTFAAATATLPLSPRLQNFRSQLFDYLLKQTQSLAPNSVFLASSDIIESIFGKYKRFSEQSPLKQMGHLLLTLPLLTTALSAQHIQTALENCSFAQVEDWFQQTFGPSALAKRRAAFQSPPPNTKVA